MKAIRPVILCGGSGTRLWPVSRADYPKQFVKFPNERSNNNTLFYYALNRVNSEKLNILDPIVIASKNYRTFINDQLKLSRKQATVFLEPVARNTATSLSMAALLEENEDPILVVLPSDQYLDGNTLNLIIEKSINECNSGNIVLLGIKPTYPETGYGYIKTYNSNLNKDFFDVECFTEKPNKDLAEKYISDGSYLWNSGIVILKASVWMKAIKICRPDIEQQCRKAFENSFLISSYELTSSIEDFLDIPSESVDYAVLEKCQNMNSDISIKVIEYSSTWTDLGSWKSIYNSVKKDTHRNFSLGDVISEDCAESLFISTSRPVVVNSLKGIAVVETSDSILVTDLDKSQNVKNLVDILKNTGYVQAIEHRRGWRPWGWYDTIDQGDKFKVKKIVVKPGASLSLQKHHFRSEHWVVVQGQANVQVGDSILTLNPNQSIYIEKEEIHRLSNSTNENLVLIEVQFGSVIEENDIVRLEDNYGRI